MLNAGDMAAEILREFDMIAGNRGNEEAHWTEIAERIVPNHSRLFTSYGNATRGEKRMQEIFDSTAAIGLNRFAAILDSLLTPRHQTWHQLRASDPYLNKQREVRLYFEEVTRLLFKYRYAPKANYTSQNQQVYKSLGAYGTGAMFIDELRQRNGEQGLRYKNVFLGEIYFMENHQGIIDSAHRRFRFTARQIMQYFGEAKTPKHVQDQMAKHPHKEFELIHCVKPRGEDYDPNRIDAKGMEWASYYVLRDGKHLLDEGGFTSFPYAISRYEQTSGEIYGRSPAMEILPAVKTLNEQKKTILKQGHRAVDPVILVHDDGIVDTFSMRPGAVNAGGVSSDGRALVQTLPVGNIAIGKDLMDDERAVINDAFLITLFQILTETPAMTATEIMERTKEKGILLAPTLGRQNSEYLGPKIEREVDLLAKLGLLPPQPQVLKEAGGKFEIQYDSPLSRAQRAEEAAGVMRTVEQALQVVNVTQNQEPLDFFDWDEIIPALAEISGVPAKWMKDVKQVQAIRQGRAQSAQAQQAVEAAPAAAALMNAETKKREAAV